MSVDKLWWGYDKKVCFKGINNECIISKTEKALPINTVTLFPIAPWNTSQKIAKTAMLCNASIPCKSISNKVCTMFPGVCQKLIAGDILYATINKFSCLPNKNNIKSAYWTTIWRMRRIMISWSWKIMPKSYFPFKQDNSYRISSDS